MYIFVIYIYIYVTYYIVVNEKENINTQLFKYDDPLWILIGFPA